MAGYGEVASASLVGFDMRLTTHLVGSTVVSVISRRNPLRCANAAAARSANTWTPTVAMRSISAGYPGMGSLSSPGRIPKSQLVAPEWVRCAAAAFNVRLTFGASCADSSARSRPTTGSPPSACTRNRTRRWSGTAAGCQASSGTSTPVIARMPRPNAAHSGSDAGPGWSSNHARARRAVSGAGTSLVRSALGRPRTSSAATSARSPGTCQVKAAGSSRVRVASGMVTVTPSWPLPGSKA